MHTRPTVESTKKEWTEATTKAISDKADAKKSYEREKEWNSDIGSFDDWASQNVPVFASSYRDYNQKRDAFFNFLTTQERAKGEELSAKYARLRYHYNRGELGDGKEKDSNWIIITYDELERYDEIMKAMEEALQKASQS